MSEQHFRHKKRGTEYVLVDFGMMQASYWHEVVGADRGVLGPTVDMREVAVYRSVDNGKLWVRPIEEWQDGRFEVLTPTAEAVIATCNVRRSPDGSSYCEEKDKINCPAQRLRDWSIVGQTCGEPCDFIMERQPETHE